MGMWTIPAVIAGVLLIIVAYFSTVSVMKKTGERTSVMNTTMDTPISKEVRDHPVVFNPIIIMYVIFGLFTGLIILYYWSVYGY